MLSTYPIKDLKTRIFPVKKTQIENLQDSRAFSYQQEKVKKKEIVSENWVFIHLMVLMK